MEPVNAAALIDSLDEAETRMERAGLLQLPFVIRQLAEHSNALAEKEAEAEKLRSELARIQQPTLFVEGVHDVELFKSALSRVDSNNQVTVKPLGGTPTTPEAIFSAIMQQGGLNSEAPVLFLFDNDKAGRGAFRKLCSKTPESEPTQFQNKMFVWSLLFTNEFRNFMKKIGIQADQAFYTAEFLFPADQAAELCKEIIDSRKSHETEEWRLTISGDYWNALTQKKCHKLIGAPAGSSEWLFARGVPDFAKAKFAVEATNRGFDTQHIDSIAKKIFGKLMDA